MARNYVPYIPQTISELIDLVTSMIGDAPTFVDKSGWFIGQNISTEFHALRQGLDVVRPKLGDDRYRRMLAMADQMRTYFEADPDDTNGETMKGIKLIHAMIDELRAAPRSKPAG